MVIGAGNQSLRYTPRRNFFGTETFTYTASDSDGKTTTATVTVQLIPGNAADDVVGISFAFRDINGNLLDNPIVSQGTQFKVDVLVDDLRTTGGSLGVFAAYLDLLYNASLVTPSANTTTGSAFNFKVDFGSLYQNGQQGSNEIPGLIDDFGAFTNAASMNQPNAVVLATLTFDALAPGLVDFAADPADDSPFTDVLLFNTPNSPVSIQQILFGRATIEIVGNNVQFPTAIDDSLATPIVESSQDNKIFVLKNDSPGSTGIMEISNVTQPANGSVVKVDGTTANSDYLQYTPNIGFVGTEQFTYTIQDDRGFTSTARVTVQVGDTTLGDEVLLELVVTDTNGQSIDEIPVGGTFQIRGYVQDLRAAGTQRGVFAAFQDVLIYDDVDSAIVAEAVASTSNPLGFDVEFGSSYSEVVSGSARNPNLINELGSVQSGNLPLGSGKFLQFIVNMTAKTVGTATFVGDPADISPFHDTLLFAPPDVVTFDKIQFISDSIKVNAVGNGGGSGEGNTNPSNRFDVNNDGFISPIDVLLVINTLNLNGPSVPNGEGEDGGRIFFDVNGDGSITAIDALMVINELNRRSGGAGEGEGESSQDYFASNDSDPMESLLGDLAADINESWNKKRR